ncbi:hypothetical protein CLAFUW4_06774 [Fulvia fulva]|uniref:Uncharacterized protein n=1 Tax=Passalora fulva TaxID=5499 RepID=A0A9Q8PB72_PASFU|nr:uncharacterized protein CLAFUR5_06911 [Fulvia fulva]KAK4621279.1 hypothetical protein CLAFUR4_06782 [Fulvia fulva]KAK4623014.1 hypothetical protein CLAFUR0_06777 [Fulvia fulva]UJO19230.1 hypothetical protein CLAFUR5_06911 [Fulvia fulva]WPV16012.1 hypothetical protein CLAFUW4_06774 [Fulvia fulva]WPV30658.1 hypothetical protein CLAFUW7_06773 [Fulvia fulva]
MIFIYDDLEIHASVECEAGKLGNAEYCDGATRVRGVHVNELDCLEAFARVVSKCNRPGAKIERGGIEADKCLVWRMDMAKLGGKHQAARHEEL